MSERPSIPLPIKREVRQRCGFGCVICGLPLYEYEHMEEWAQVKRHIAEEITLLCDQHHREKTSGLLPKSTVAAANKDPYNLREGESKAYLLHYAGKHAEVNIAGNIFTATDISTGPEDPVLLHAVMIDRTVLVGFVFVGNTLLLHLTLFDRFNFPILIVRENELVYKPISWDIEFVGTTLTLREKKSEIFVEIIFNPPNKISILRGKLMHNGVELKLTSKGVIIPNHNIRYGGNKVGASNIGLTVGDSPKGALSITHVERYLS